MIRLALRVGRDGAEVALAELLDLAPAGVEEVDLGDVVEYAVYGAPGELPSLPQLRAAAGAAMVEVSTSELPDDWSQRWREFHRPVLVRPRQATCPDVKAAPELHVRPPWEPPRPAGGDGSAVHEIVIDPGLAFGTGAHATTRLCLEIMLGRAAAGQASGPLVDLGCGSGVLAIAAVRLGWDPVLALDHDPLSVAATVENARVNDVDLQARRFDLRRDRWPAVAADPQGSASSGDRAGGATVVANLLRPLLLELSRSLDVTPRCLVAGGLLVAEVDEVAGALGQRLGLVERTRCSAGEWAAIELERPPAAPEPS